MENENNAFTIQCRGSSKSVYSLRLKLCLISRHQVDGTLSSDDCSRNSFNDLSCTGFNKDEMFSLACLIYSVTCLFKIFKFRKFRLFILKKCSKCQLFYPLLIIDDDCNYQDIFFKLYSLFETLDCQ